MSKNIIGVLGIDPGYDKLGLAVVEGSAGREPSLVFSHCFRTTKTLPFADRLLLVGQELEKVLKEYQPAAVGLEKVFFATNRKTASQIAEVRGVLTYLIRSHHLPIWEYTPLQVKMRITGWGQADKRQVITMVTKLAKLKSPLKEDDEYDALALAITTFHDHTTSLLSTSNS